VGRYGAFWISEFEGGQTQAFLNDRRFSGEVANGSVSRLAAKYLNLDARAVITLREQRRVPNVVGVFMIVSSAVRH
jgi:hypothetical protein